MTKPDEGIRYESKIKISSVAAGGVRRSIRWPMRRNDSLIWQTCGLADT